MTDQNEYLKDPRLIETHYGEEYEHYYNAIVPPVFLNSLNVFPTIDDYYDSDKTDRNVYCYGRVQNPTVRIAALEHGEKAFVFSSGMAAATTAVMAVCRTGSHIVCVRNVYGPLKTFLTQYCTEHFQMQVTFVKGDRLEEFEEAITDDTDLVESPSSIMMTLQDIQGVAAIAGAHRARIYIDNTYCTPIFQNPLDLGADMVMHTLSKYIGGHSDIIGGVLVAKDKELLAKLSLMRELYGGILGPMEAWLGIRGIRTLEVRLRQHEKTALAVAAYLEKQPRVKKVHYPGLPSFQQYELMQKQQQGNCGLMSFELDGSVEQAKAFCQALRVFKIGVSWGGFESLVTMPFARASEEETAWLGGAQNLIRIHCGLEGEENLIADLEQAFAAL